MEDIERVAFAALFDLLDWLPKNRHGSRSATTDGGSLPDGPKKLVKVAFQVAAGIISETYDSITVWYSLATIG